MTDTELIEAFERGEMPAGGFHHAEHIRAARYYLSRHPLTEAMQRFDVALRRFAAAQGQPTLYHATITIAFLLIVAERLGRSAAGETWAEFAAAHPDLLAWKPSVLDRYYTSETLWSEGARRHFVMPDRLAPAPSEPARRRSVTLES